MANFRFLANFRFHTLTYNEIQILGSGDYARINLFFIGYKYTRAVFQNKTKFIPNLHREIRG